MRVFKCIITRLYRFGGVLVHPFLRPPGQNRVQKCDTLWSEAGGRVFGRGVEMCNLRTESEQVQRVVYIRYAIRFEQCALR